MNITQIIKHFVEGFHKNIQTSNKTFTYIPPNLFSYAEKLAYLENDVVYILPVTAKYGNFFSMTTSTHFGRVKNFCEENNINYEIIGNSNN